MEEFDTYLFDFDGTLVDSFDSLVKIFQGAYRAIGVEVEPSFVRRLMRISLQQGFEELHAPVDEKSIQIFSDELIRLLHDPEVTKLVKTYDDVKRTLILLKSMGKTIGIVTSNHKKHVKEVLEVVDIDENLSSVIVGNKETKRYKPFPDPILKALEILGKSKEQACYVGDGLDDMESAAAAGVYPILLDRLDEYGDSNHFVIKTLDELY